MKKIGINIRLNLNTWPEFSKRIKTRSVELFAISWLADYPDAENFLQLFYGPNAAPGANGTNYSNPEFDKLYEKIVIMQDSPERTKIYAKMAKIIAEDLPWIFGVHRMNFRLIHGWVENYKATEFRFGMEQWLNVNKSKKKELLKKL